MVVSLARLSRRRFCTACVAFGVGGGFSVNGIAQQSQLTKSRADLALEFRIDVDHYSDETRPPVAQFKTIFTKTKSIEIDDLNNIATVIDLAQQTIAVYDSKRRMMSEIDMPTVDQRLSEIISRMDEKVKLASSPTSEPTRDSDNRIRVGNSMVEYRVQASAPQNPEIAIRYAEYADWATKLAAVFPPYKPPQMRLALNSYLLDNRLLPMETRRKTKGNNGSQEIVARLLVKSSLSSEDQKEIVRVQKWAEEFKIVSATEYFAIK